MLSNWDLEKFFALLWRQRGALVFTVVAMLFLGVLYMHVTKPSYTVSMQLVPAPAALQSNDNSGGLSALAGGLLGGSNNPTSFKIYLAGLQSHAASEMIARDQNIMRRMFAAQWSEDDHVWRESAGPLHSAWGVVKGVLGVHVDDWRPPSADDVYSYLQDSVKIVDSHDSPIITVSIQSSDPRLAADFLKVLTDDVDALTRQRALNRANEYIAYIGHELDRVTVSEYRQSLINHLNDQEKSRMMASATKVGYSADIFSGPMVSQRPTAPKLVPVMLMFLVLGCFLGFLLGLIYDLRGRIFTLSLLGNTYPRRHKRGGLADGVGR